MLSKYVKAAQLRLISLHSFSECADTKQLLVLQVLLNKSLEGAGIELRTSWFG